MLTGGDMWDDVAMIIVICGQHEHFVNDLMYFYESTEQWTLIQTHTCRNELYSRKKIETNTNTSFKMAIPVFLSHSFFFLFSNELFHSN